MLRALTLPGGLRARDSKLTVVVALLAYFLHASVQQGSRIARRYALIAEGIHRATTWLRDVLCFLGGSHAAYVGTPEALSVTWTQSPHSSVR